MTPRLLTVRQVAALVHHDASTVRTWIRQGQLPAIRVRDGYLVEASALAGLMHPGATPNDWPGLARAGTAMDTAPEGRRYGDHTGGAPICAPSAPTPEASMPDLTAYLSLAEAAVHIGRSTRTIRRWVGCGDLPRALRIKGRLLIHAADLDEMYTPANAESFRGRSSTPSAA